MRPVSTPPVERTQGSARPHKKNFNYIAADIKTALMEVHHASHVGRKKVKEYFLEFLMIFLAVTLGFFAESPREHLADNKKEREYIHGMVSDIKKDTANLAQVLRYFDMMLPMMDSGRKNFYKLQQPHSIETLRGIQYSLGGFEDFIYTGATLQQVKSSGGMMPIKNKLAVDSILKYDSKVKTALMNEKVLGDLMVSMQHSMAAYSICNRSWKQPAEAPTLRSASKL